LAEVPMAYHDGVDFEEETPSLARALVARDPTHPARPRHANTLHGPDPAAFVAQYAHRRREPVEFHALFFRVVDFFGARRAFLLVRRYTQ